MLTAVEEILSGEAALSPGGPLDLATVLDEEPALWGCQAPGHQWSAVVAAPAPERTAESVANR